MEYIYIAGKTTIPESFVVGQGESLRITLVVLPGVNCDIPINIEIEAEDADVDIAGIYLCPKDEKVKISLNMRHLAGHSCSRQLFKGIVGGTAHSEFNGLIYVAKDSQKIKAYQENHNLLLSDKAIVDTLPQLEIYADDVECTHGATVGKLNEDELFYMRSRGIPEQEARAIQMRSFISTVTERIEDENLLEQIYESLSQC